MKQAKHLLLICATSLLLFLAAGCKSCNDKKANSPEEVFEEEPAPGTLAIHNTGLLSHQLPEWVSYLRLDATRWGRYYVADSTPFEHFEPAAMPNDMFTEFKPYFIYSTDSSKALDIYSYNLVLEKRKSGWTASGREPDIQVNLIDVSNKTAQRIYFTGTGTTLVDGAWLNDSTVAVVGFEAADDNYLYPSVKVFYLKSQLIKNYLSPDSVKALFSDYFKHSRLKAFNFE